MDLIKKIEIINEFAAEHLDIDDEDIQKFFILNNLGVPYAIGATNGYLTLTKAGEEIIEETYSDLCKFLEIDENEEYEDYDDFMSS